MTAITANQVKELRDKTGAGMMECKKALQETNGDFEGAVKYLREKGITKAEKRAARSASEGLIVAEISADLTSGSLVEINCETDFVARNEDFIKLANSLGKAALANNSGSAEALGGITLPEYNKDANSAVQDLLAIIGEKIVLNRATTLSGDVIAGYIHPPGKIGVLIAGKLEGADKGKSAEVLRDIAMHIAALSPRRIVYVACDPAALARDVATFDGLGYRLTDVQGLDLFGHTAHRPWSDGGGSGGGWCPAAREGSAGHHPAGRAR